MASFSDIASSQGVRNTSICTQQRTLRNGGRSGEAAITGNESAQFAERSVISVLLNLLTALRQCGQPGGPVTT
jgi:hypothetical protein